MARNTRTHHKWQWILTIREPVARDWACRTVIHRELLLREVSARRVGLQGAQYMDTSQMVIVEVTVRNSSRDLACRADDRHNTLQMLRRRKNVQRWTIQVPVLTKHLARLDARFSGGMHCSNAPIAAVQLGANVIPMQCHVAKPAKRNQLYALTRPGAYSPARAPPRGCQTRVLPRPWTWRSRWTPGRRRRRR